MAVFCPWRRRPGKVRLTRHTKRFEKYFSGHFPRNGTIRQAAPRGFPKNLIERGFIYHGDIGWYKDDAVLAVEWLHGKSAAIVDAEVWLVKNAFVQPHIRTADGLVTCHYSTTTVPDESWQAFANRSLNEATAFILQFQWPDNAVEVGEPEVRFCLSWVWREWIEEDKFRFPK